MPPGGIVVKWVGDLVFFSTFPVHISIFREMKQLRMAPNYKRKSEEGGSGERQSKKAATESAKEAFVSDAKDSTGTAWNFKIASWNVAGLRACAKKDGFKYIVKEDPDIMCLQETKCTKAKLPIEAELKDYHPYWLSGKDEGYCGVGLYSKKKPLNVTYGIGDKTQDEEARLITAEYDNFYLVTSYVPNSGRKLVTLPKRMAWDKLLKEHLQKLDEKKPVIYCGDLNVSHKEIDLKNPATNKKNAGFTQEERDGFTDLLTAGQDGLVDTFRHFYPDKKDAYTFWTFMGNARAKDVGWRLDYFVVSKRLMPRVCDSLIRKEVMGSDHCPIVLLMNTEGM
ncbi:exodeoxyribonuclease-like isoform X1 [Amphibalanus amphitrite]|uniref:exodeoxyribonuclease-like isoform X1 n=2 Tax=Amphibalanus amphitrite TaxID=1232801 RepID=UPI001C90EC43|nr:exodeoxyribonuclease-like isoform X1 [Amphibalanus amphitrite]